MFIIFGVDNRKVEEKQSQKMEHCFHCNNTSYWLAAKATDNFSLFFIPLIPFKTTYSYRCPICNQGRMITKEEYDLI